MHRGAWVDLVGWLDQCVFRRGKLTVAFGIVLGGLGFIGGLIMLQRGLLFGASRRGFLCRFDGFHLLDGIGRGCFGIHWNGPFVML